MGEAEYHSFAPIRTVAVVGLGASGAPATRHLRDAGLAVTTFERQNVSGGIWNWRPEVGRPLSVPTPPPSRGAFIPVVPSDLKLGDRRVEVREDPDGELRARFSPPNPVYRSLSNNVPTSTMAFKDFPYPPGTAENIPHNQIAGYMHAYVKHFNLDANVEYNTRVELATKVETKDGDKWRLTLHKLEPDGTSPTSVRETFWVQDFDALVVATGHYNAPFIPGLEGASSWAAAWPDAVLHSSGYRVPETYAGRDVLIVGSGTSGIDIARDLTPVARKVYMVGKDDRGGAYARVPDGYRIFRKLQRHFVPGTNAEPVGPIKQFRPPPPGASIEEGEVELADGRVLTGISAVLFSTGYQYSVPFLPQFHRDPVPGASRAADHDRLLVTDGGGVLNLYRDVFYLPDPTLAFLGLSVNTSAFSFFEYQSLSIARVWGGTARLPSEAYRRAVYEQLVAERGEGKFTHFMGKDNERKYVREAVEWLNRDAAWSGAPPVEGHSEAWLAASDRVQGTIAAKYGLDPQKLFAQIKAEIEAEKAEAAASAASNGQGEAQTPPEATQAASAARTERDNSEPSEPVFTTPTLPRTIPIDILTQRPDSSTAFRFNRNHPGFPSDYIGSLTEQQQVAVPSNENKPTPGKVR